MGLVVHDTTRGNEHGSIYEWRKSYRLTENGIAGASGGEIKGLWMSE